MPRSALAVDEETKKGILGRARIVELAFLTALVTISCDSAEAAGVRDGAGSEQDATSTGNPQVEAGPDRETASTCSLSSIRDISACPTATGTWFEDGATPLPSTRGPYSLVGTITDILPGGSLCGDTPSFAPGWTLRIADATHGLELYGLPGAQPVVALGDVVDVESFYQSNGYFASPDAYTTVRTSEGTLIYWTVTAGNFSSLRVPPDLSALRGEADCAGTQLSCGSFEIRSLDIASGAQSVSLSPGETRQVGEYVVTLAAFEEQTASTFQCADWYVGAITISAVRATMIPTASSCGGRACSDAEYCATNPDGSCFDTDSASCQPRPNRDACPTDCPGLCGCDGHFYCNDCFAKSAGVAPLNGFTECVAPLCGGSGSSSAGECDFTWTCKEAGYPFDYGVSCAEIAGEWQCDCKLDGATDHTVTLASAPGPSSCGSLMVLDACGFPHAILGQWAP